MCHIHKPHFLGRYSRYSRPPSTWIQSLWYWCFRQKYWSSLDAVHVDMPTHMVPQGFASLAITLSLAGFILPGSWYGFAKCPWIRIPAVPFWKQDLRWFNTTPRFSGLSTYFRVFFWYWEKLACDLMASFTLDPKLSFVWTWTFRSPRSQWFTYSRCGSLVTRNGHRRKPADMRLTVGTATSLWA